MFSPLDLLALIGLVFGTLAAGAFLAFAVVRWRLTRRIAAALGPGKIMLTAPARMEPLGGRASSDAPSGGERLRGWGLLVLLPGGLYFHSWLGDRELFVAGPSITYIGVPDPGARSRRARGPITLRYLNAAAKEDGIAIRLPYAEQWAEAIRTRLIGRKS
ncbi:MAG: hypothetical protein NTU62_02730 [Spirochaetes bacterium]|nr:hypothetical protein [Spirochaetota bacterium]